MPRKRQSLARNAPDSALGEDFLELLKVQQSGWNGRGPRPPEPKDFGITAADVEDADRRNKFAHDASLAIGWIVGIAIGISCIAILNLPKESKDIKGLVCLGFPLIFVLPPLAFHLCKRIIKNRVSASLSKPLLSFLKERSAFPAMFLEWRRQQRRQSRDTWQDLDGWAFERRFADLSNRMGYGSIITPGSNDGGVDVILQLGREMIAVQCKAHSRPIGPGALREFYGVLCHDKRFSNGIFVSTNGYSQAALEFAKGKQILLITLDDIVSREVQLASGKRPRLWHEDVK